MKKLITTTFLVAILMLPVVFAPAVQAEPWHERHPEIHKALHALENAKQDLQQAKHDFGGHRDAALQACDAAIVQLREVLKYDRY